MILSDKKIIEEMDKGNVIISPFRKENLSTSSYDVTIGENYYRETVPDTYDPVYDIHSKEQTAKIFGELHTAKSRWPAAQEVGVSDPKQIESIPIDAKVVFIRPGETILSHTNEFIGGKGRITTMMKARSSYGRNFIGVCKCAGWGDVGFTDRWTMEITNFSKYYTIPLIVGKRIAQVVFLDTYPVEEGSEYGVSGKYTTKGSQEDIEKNWQPDSMLPKLYKDK